MYQTLTGLGPDIVENNRKIYQILENFLKRSTFIAGDTPTIADISVYTSLTQMDVSISINVENLILSRTLPKIFRLSYTSHPIEKIST